MCTKEEVREVLLEEFNGEFVKELPVLLQGIKDQLGTLETSATEIKTRLDVANGRTKTNERAIAMAQGGLIVVSLIAVPMLGWALFTLVNLQNTITDIVEKELATYKFEIVE